jgi:rod shape-determining protein MreC
MDYVPRQEEVQEGDLVVTAGIDGVYPRGIAIGRVVRLEAGTDLFHRILIAPAVELDALDHAYVLLGEKLPEELTEADSP